MKHGSLFSGIGGFDLAAEWAGWENMFHCEWNPFGQKVLKHYWPNAATYEDITKTDFTIWRGRIDILTGGFPCQPYSAAGKRLGKEDERHLWPEMLRVIREVQPRWVVGENVLGLVNWNGGLVFDEVQADLEAEGYEVQPFILPAASVNAPHKRDRVWFVAYRTTALTQNPDCDGRQGNEWQEKPCEWEQRNACSGDNERLQADNGKAGATSHPQGNDDKQQGGKDNTRRENVGRWEAEVWPESARYGNSGATSHAGKFRLELSSTPRTLGEGQEEICREGHKPSLQPEANECFGITPDTDSLRHTSCGEGTEAQGIGCGNNGEQKERSEQAEWPNGLLGLQPNAPNATSCGRGQVGGQRESRFLNETGEIGNWDNFPTQSPFHMRDDGIPKKLAIFVVKEFYDTDSYTSQENRIENLHEVWGRISQEEVWEKVRRLYSLDTKEILFQTMQLYSSGYENKRRLSPFSEEVSKEPMRILRKYKKFASSPQGQELAKQRYGEYSDIMCDLPHEVALAARAYTNSIRKFEAWHRQEAIKAGGNAIVPQVVLQIFKAINEYREKYP